MRRFERDSRDGLKILELEARIHEGPLASPSSE